MEKEQINVAELLKDCPKGMELYSPMFGTVFFEGVIDTGRAILIDVTTSSNTSVQFYSDGKFNTYYTDSEVTLFPSKGKTWEGFVPPCKFQDGDIVAHDNEFGNVELLIYKESISDIVAVCYLFLNDRTELHIVETAYVINRLATEEEKAKLFQAIKDNGYRWNSETKSLEKLVTPKFKVGDKIREKGDEAAAFAISDIDDSCYYYGEHVICNICDQEFFELVPNKFDITTLKPFESRVLVRDTKDSLWKPAIFGFYNGEKKYYYVVGGHCWMECIPYEGNEHLMGKTDDCDEYFKTWSK
jgi:hypothetical protein